MKSWISEINCSKIFDRTLEPEDTYYDFKVNRVRLPHEVDPGITKWELEVKYMNRRIFVR